MRSDLRLCSKLGTAKWPDEYHPVLCHPIDVGCASVCIWCEVVRDRLRKHIACGIGMAAPDDVGPWLRFLTGAHDIGKASPDFHCRKEDVR